MRFNQKKSNACMCAHAFSTDVAAQLRHEMHGDAAVSWQYLCSGVGASALETRLRLLL
jgi:hypothetical protein